MARYLILDYAVLVEARACFVGRCLRVGELRCSKCGYTFCKKCVAERVLNALLKGQTVVCYHCEAPIQFEKQRRNVASK